MTVPKKRRQSSTERRINKALAIAFRYRTATEPQHLKWVIDKMVRELTGSRYEQTIKAALLGTHHPLWDGGECP